MKVNQLLSCSLLLGASFFYSSCKKSETKVAPTTPTTDYKALSSQAALGLYQALTGKAGGVNLGSGTTAPFSVPVKQSGPVTFDVGQCGFTTNPVSTFNTTVGDSVSTEVIHWNFTSTCSSGKTSADGYTVKAVDSIKSLSPNYSTLKVLVQNYVVQALDATYKTVSTNGSLAYNLGQNYLHGPSYNPFGNGSVNTDGSQQLQSFQLTGLVIDVSSGVPDITKGTAVFNYQLQVTNINHPYGGPIGGAQANITYLGNYQAKVTFLIPGGTTQSYMVNVLTGVVTPA